MYRELDSVHFGGQVKRDLTEMCEDDNKYWGVDEKPPDTIYRDTQHRLYYERWDHAKRLRYRSRDVINRSRENHWDSFLEPNLFEGIIDQTYEWVVQTRKAGGKRS